MLVVCCKCKRMRFGEKWSDIKHIEGGPVSHTYCPDCAAEAMVEIDQISAEINSEDDS